MESILNSMKQMIGPGAESTAFDVDLIIHINSVFSDLYMLGVGPPKAFKITGTYEIWSDFTKDCDVLESVKTYMYLRLRLLFDPPTSSAVMEAYKEQIAKYEWLHNVAAETPV